MRGPQLFDDVLVLRPVSPDIFGSIPLAAGAESGEELLLRSETSSECTARGHEYYRSLMEADLAHQAEAARFAGKDEQTVLVRLQEELLKVRAGAYDLEFMEFIALVPPEREG